MVMCETSTMAGKVAAQMAVMVKVDASAGAVTVPAAAAKVMAVARARGAVGRVVVVEPVAA